MLLLLATFLIFAAPDLRVNWTDVNKTAVKIQVEQHDPMLRSCLQGGLAMRYRFETQICKRRRFWLDGCLRDSVETRILTYNPITDRYELTSDRHRDGSDPSTEIFDKIEKAMPALATVASLPINFVAQENEKYLRSSRSYLQVRAFSDCIGGGGQFLEKVSSRLSLGLIEIHGFDTGWLEYEFKK